MDPPPPPPPPLPPPPPFPAPPDPPSAPAAPSRGNVPPSTGPSPLRSKPQARVSTESASPSRAGQGGAATPIARSMLPPSWTGSQARRSLGRDDGLEGPEAHGDEDDVYCHQELRPELGASQIGGDRVD